MERDGNVGAGIDSDDVSTVGVVRIDGRVTWASNVAFFRFVIVIAAFWIFTCKKSVNYKIDSE